MKISDKIKIKDEALPIVCTEKGHHGCSFSPSCASVCKEECARKVKRISEAKQNIRPMRITPCDIKFAQKTGRVIGWLYAATCWRYDSAYSYFDIPFNGSIEDSISGHLDEIVSPIAEFWGHQNLIFVFESDTFFPESPKNGIYKG